MGELGYKSVTALTESEKKIVKLSTALRGLLDAIYEAGKTAAAGGDRHKAALEEVARQWLAANSVLGETSDD